MIFLSKGPTFGNIFQEKGFRSCDLKNKEKYKCGQKAVEMQFLEAKCCFPVMRYLLNKYFQIL